MPQPTKRKNAFTIRLDVMPNCPLPLTVLASMGNANVNTARRLAYDEKIKTYQSKENVCMVSVEEMERLRELGMIEVNGI